MSQADPQTQITLFVVEGEKESELVCSTDQLWALVRQPDEEEPEDVIEVAMQRLPVDYDVVIQGNTISQVIFSSPLCLHVHLFYVV